MTAPRRYVLVCHDGRERDRFNRERAGRIPDGFGVLSVLVAPTAQLLLRGTRVHAWELTDAAGTHGNARLLVPFLEYLVRKTEYEDLRHAARQSGTVTA